MNQTPRATEHFFTVDVEEYFQVSTFEPYLDRGDWDKMPSRVAVGVEELLAALERCGAHGTFFTLGWIAKRHRRLVESIALAGHEVASHGWDHRRVTTLTPDAFREQVRSSKATLEDIVGTAVLGYRAPSFSIVKGLEWALDILAEEGYRYDSSLYPVQRPGYGYAGGQRDPYWLERPSGRLAEFPPATLRRLGLNLPAAGGAYLRILPLGLVRTAIREFNGRGIPTTVYIHPWEVDPEQPRIRVRTLARMRHYTGLERTLERLERLLSEFRFTSISRSPHLNSQATV
jgi:polysaccharide deacetylase family protein (PEP-CTERM system associated)